MASGDRCESQRGEAVLVCVRRGWIVCCWSLEPREVVQGTFLLALAGCGSEHKYCTCSMLLRSIVTCSIRCMFRADFVEDCACLRPLSIYLTSLER